MSYSGNRTHAEREMKEHGGRQPEKRRGDGGLHTEQGEALRATGSEFYEVSTYDTKYVKGPKSADGLELITSIRLFHVARGFRNKLARAVCYSPLCGGAFDMYAHGSWRPI